MPMAFMVVFMRSASHTGIYDFTFKICGCDIPDVPGTSSYHFDMMGCKDIQGSLPHISRQHHADTHLLQFIRYVGLAAASLRRRNGFAPRNLIVLIYCQNGVILTVTEMVIYHVFLGRNCNFHHNLFFNVNTVYHSVR